MKDVNSQYFDEEQVKAGELYEFLSLLMKQCYGKGNNYNDIHIRPEDCGAFSIEWASSPWDHSYPGKLVALVKLKRNKSALASRIVGIECNTLDNSLFCDHNQIFFFVKFGNPYH